MSIRARLTLTMSILSGVALFAFSALIYLVISVIMLDTIDARINDTSNQILGQLKTVGPNQFDVVGVSNYRDGDPYIIQVYGLDKSLKYSNIVGDQNPLDDYAWQLWKPVYTTVDGVYGHMRILSTPIYNQRGAAGLLMIGYSIDLFDYLQKTLLVVLIVVSIILLIFLGLAEWWLFDLSVRPLKQVTDVLPRILEADDLSRRIPYQIAPEDELGKLVKMINNMLERLEKQLSAQKRFLSDVSHELRTPLTVIKGEVGLLRRAGELDEESLHSIEAEVDRLTRLVGDLLLLGQAESGKLQLNLTSLELDDLLVKVMHSMEKLAGGKIKLQIGVIEPVIVNADEDRIKQVLINLIGNAVHHTPSGGSVTVSLQTLAARVQVTISDTGPGIPEADLPHIFERFYRGEKSRKRTPGGGFGLGLSISYWIIRSHGGMIDVISQEGKGTTFTFWLPLTDKSSNN